MVHKGKTVAASAVRTVAFHLDSVLGFFFFGFGFQFWFRFRVRFRICICVWQAEADIGRQDAS